MLVPAGMVTKAFAVIRGQNDEAPAARDPVPQADGSHQHAGAQVCVVDLALIETSQIGMFFGLERRGEMELSEGDAPVSNVAVQVESLGPAARSSPRPGWLVAEMRIEVVHPEEGAARKIPEDPGEG